MTARDDEAPPAAAPRPAELSDFLLHLEKERDVSPHTLAAYARDLDGFVTYLSQQRGTESFSWDGVDRLTMRGYLGFLTRKGLSKRSIARALSALQAKALEAALAQAGLLKA